MDPQGTQEPLPHDHVDDVDDDVDDGDDDDEGVASETPHSTTAQRLEPRWMMMCFFCFYIAFTS